MIDRRSLFRIGAAASAWALGGGRVERWIGDAGRREHDRSPRPNVARVERDSRSGDDRTLVILQLYGGNDGFNTLVRHGNDDYRRARPNLAIPRASVLPLDDERGLHPSLRRTREWWDRGAVAFVEGVGSDRTNLSHFKSDAVWQSGAAGVTEMRTGWIGRWLDQRIEADLADGRPEPSSLTAISIGRDVLPVALRAARARPPTIPDLDAFTRERDGCALDQAPVMRGESRAQRELLEEDVVLRAALEARTKLARASELPALADYPGTEIGRNLRSVGKVLRAGLGTRVVYTTMASFDTHTFQAEEHARLLHELDEALNAFLHDLRAQGRLERTLVITQSEFGRRLAENGVGVEAGTDHGRASVSFALGAVHAGFHGAAPSFADLDADGNVRAPIDFRRVYAGVLRDWLGADPASVLAAGVEPLPFVRG